MEFHRKLLSIFYGRDEAEFEMCMLDPKDSDAIVCTLAGLTMGELGYSKVVQSVSSENSWLQPRG